MGWPTQSLETVAAVIRGVSFDKSEVTAEPGEGLLPILRAGNISDALDTRSDLIWVPSTRVKPEQRLRPGDIAICMSSGSQAVVGKSAPLREDWSGSVGAFCAIIRPEQSRIDPEFLALYMRSETFRAWTRRSEGANIKNIRHSELLDVRIPVPPMDQQRHAVDLLSRSENIVRMRREAEKKTKEIIPALFLDMFGDPATNPKGWENQPVGDVIRSAEYGTSTKASEVESGVPVIRMGNVESTGRLSLTDLKYVVLPEDERRKYTLQSGDILFNRTNSKDLVGKTGIWRGDTPAVAASYFIRVRLNEEIMLPDYFWAFMNTSHMKSVLYLTARGAIGQSNINAQELRAFVVPSPPRSLQKTFARRVDEALDLEGQQSLASSTARTAFQSLLAGMFQG